MLLLALACKASRQETPETATAAVEDASETTPKAPATPEDAGTALLPAAAELPDTLPTGLLLAYSQFEVVDGEATAKPGPARLDIVTREGGEWRTETVEDAQSNVFHKAMLLDAPGPRARYPHARWLRRIREALET